MEQDLTLRAALAADRLDDFVRQEVAMGAELVNGSELERALALLISRHRRAPKHPDPIQDATERVFSIQFPTTLPYYCRMRRVR
jgi:hypothetical protein